MVLNEALREQHGLDMGFRFRDAVSQSYYWSLLCFSTHYCSIKNYNFDRRSRADMSCEASPVAILKKGHLAVWRTRSLTSRETSGRDWRWDERDKAVMVAKRRWDETATSCGAERMKVQDETAASLECNTTPTWIEQPHLTERRRRIWFDFLDCMHLDPGSPLWAIGLYMLRPIRGCSQSMDGLIGDFVEACHPSRLGKSRLILWFHRRGGKSMEEQIHELAGRRAGGRGGVVAGCVYSLTVT